MDENGGERVRKEIILDARACVSFLCLCDD